MTWCVSAGSVMRACDPHLRRYMCSWNNKTWAVIQETELKICFIATVTFMCSIYALTIKLPMWQLCTWSFLLWLNLQSSQNDQIYVLLSITAPYGMSDWNRVLVAWGCYPRGAQKSVVVILFTQKSYPSILHVVELLWFLVLENASMAFWLKSGTEMTVCLVVDNTAKVISLSWPMVFCKNVLIQSSVKKHLYLSTVVTGSVPTLFSDVTVSEKNCCEVF